MSIYYNGRWIEIKYHFWRHQNGHSTHMVGYQVYALPEGGEAPLADLTATGGADEIMAAVNASYEMALDDLDLVDWNDEDDSADEWDDEYKPCPLCDGEGLVDYLPCPECDGEGAL